MTISQTEKAFTLLELLVTLTILGVLAAVAIPHYQDYRERSFDFRALSDLRSVALAEEAYFLDWESYKSCSGASCGALPGMTALSKGVTLEIVAADDGFVGTSSHSKGTGKKYRWDSGRGGLQE